MLSQEEDSSMFESAFRDAAIGMALVALDGRWLKVNDAVCAIVGYTREELLATNFQAITHPDDLAPDLDLVRKLLEGRIHSYHLEKRYVHRQGHFVEIMLTVSLVRRDGGPAFFISQIQDLTARRSAERDAQLFFESSIDMLAITGGAGTLDRVNRAWEQTLGWSREELTSRPLLEFVHPEDRARTKAASASAPVHASILRNRCFDVRGAIHWLEWSFAATPRGARFCIARDVTAQVEALHEKEVLLKEVHHRVKNNLQMVSSLLNLQAAQFPEGALRGALTDAQQRIHSIALVHARLHEARDVDTIRFQSYAEALVRDVSHVHGAAQRGISMLVLAEDVTIPIDSAVFCGLVINELVVNALKHAFPGQRSGTIRVEVAKLKTNVELLVGDDGAGLPAAHRGAQGGSLGFELVRTFAEQLRATLTLDSGGAGTIWHLVFDPGSAHRSVPQE